MAIPQYKIKALLKCGKFSINVVCMCAKSLQSCPTLGDPMDHNRPDSSVHWILQARILSGLQWLPPGDLPNSGIEVPKKIKKETIHWIHLSLYHILFSLQPTAVQLSSSAFLCHCSCHGHIILCLPRSVLCDHLMRSLGSSIQHTWLFTPWETLSFLDFHNTTPYWVLPPCNSLTVASHLPLLSLPPLKVAVSWGLVFTSFL